MTVRWTVSDRPSDRPPDRPFFHRLAFPGGGPPGPRRPPSRPPVPSAGPLPSPCARVFSSHPPIPPSGRRRCPPSPLRFPALPSLVRWTLAGQGFAAPFARDPNGTVSRTVKNYFVAGCSGYFFRPQCRGSRAPSPPRRARRANAARGARAPRSEGEEGERGATVRGGKRGPGRKPRQNKLDTF